MSAFVLEGVSNMIGLGFSKDGVPNMDAPPPQVESPPPKFPYRSQPLTHNFIFHS